MTWSAPFALFGLVAIPFVFYFVAKSARRKRAAVEAVLSAEMLARLAPPRSKTLAVLKNVFLLLALVAFVLTLAGPKFGRVEETTSTFGRDLFVLLDVSDSTLAEDVAPNRLTVAKLDVEDLLDASVGDRIGLIAFAGSAQVEIPLTTDRTFFRELLQNVDTTTVKLGGTAIGDAIRLALSRFGAATNRERAIVLLTDGEDWSSLPFEAAKNAASAGVPIFAIAIGDLRGAKIPLVDAAGRRVGFKTFDGAEAISKPDVETLKEIAKISGGKFYYADATLDLADVYKNGIDLQKRTRFDEKSRVVLKDRYRPFLAFGLVAFAVYYYFPTRTRGRRNGANFSAALVAAIVLSNVFAFGGVPTFAQDATSQDAAKTILKNRRSEIDAFNRSASAARAGRVDDALRTQAILDAARTPEVAGRARFNLGADATRRLLESDRLFAERQRSNAENDSADAAKQEKTTDATARYEQERSERKTLQDNMLQESSEAARRFGAAETNRSTRQKSREAADALVRWETSKRDEWRDAEARERSRLLANPDERLRWALDETRRRAERVERLNATPKTADFYRGLFEESRSESAVESDVAAVAERLVPVLANDRGDAEGSRLVKAAQDEFSRRERAAAERFAKFDGAAGRDELRRAESELRAMQDVATPYETLLNQRVAEEEKTTSDLPLDAVRNASRARLDELVRSRATLRRSVDELIRKATKGIDAQDANGPNADKIRESMQIAVERGPEIAPELEKIQRLASSESASDAAEKIVAAQQKALEILKEIAKPLQDDRSSRQNDQNDQNNSSNDDARQNQNDDQRQSDDGKSESNATPDRLNEGARPDADDLKDASQPTSDENSRDDSASTPQNERDDDAKNAQEKDVADSAEASEKTEAQKEAEALTRQVYRRQKDAQAERRAVRQALQKREKSGKDW